MPEAQAQDPDDPDPYPEHARLEAVSDESQTCGDFLSWLRQEKDVQLGRPHVHDDDTCYEPHDCDDPRHDCDIFGECQRTRSRVCGFDSNQFEPYRYNLQDLLAEFFGIDRERLEAEKRAMLDDLRDTHDEDDTQEETEDDADDT